MVVGVAISLAAAAGFMLETGQTAVGPAKSVKLTRIGRFSSPVYVTAPPGDQRHLFVVEKPGTVRALVDGKPQQRPFLDLTGQVRWEGNEQGLLSLAFSPDYAASGRFYVDYVDLDGNEHVVEFRRSRSDPMRADPGTRRELLFVPRPSGEHYGGLLLFGPDGYLYLGLGDGGLTRDKDSMRAQRPSDLNGKILRIDPRPTATDPYRIPPSNPYVGQAGWRPEIWALGLRNPWRYWIDPKTSDLYIGDVGEYVRESIKYAPGPHAAGTNFGWPCYEGNLPSATFGPELCPGRVPALLEYAREGVNCAVIGGVVVRDPRLQALVGRYLYTDYCGGEIDSILVRRGRIVKRVRLDLERRAGITSFGQDALGRVYLTTLTGDVFRLDPRVKAAPPTEPILQGRSLFVSNGCGNCHTLAAAGGTGTVGPNLDLTKPSRELVIERVTKGTAVMPSFKDVLSQTQIEKIADFVVQATR